MNGGKILIRRIILFAFAFAIIFGCVNRRKDGLIKVLILSSFFTILGHDERAILNTGLQTILLRATQWTSHRKVTIEPPAGLGVIKTSG